LSNSNYCFSFFLTKDPHFITFDGTKYSYHGECDLVMFQNPNFDSGLGIALHIRTEIVTTWSLISNAALRVGNDTFELVNNEDYYINGVKNPVLPWSLAGKYVITKSLQPKRTAFKVDMLHGQSITFDSFKRMIGVKVSASFGSIGGMNGMDGLQGVIARDGRTQLYDPNAMGDEWQVNGNEPILFHDLRVPQYPQHCKLPTTASNLRRLRKKHGNMLKAETACKDVSEGMKQFCIEDVLLTNDVSVANGYFGGTAV
jgi:von Willebrand factor type D domain